MTLRLRADGVGKAFGPKRALRDVSLEARPGEILCVLGASGSGKSTLLRLLHLLVAPSAGRVLVDDVAPPATGAARLACVRRMALVQQTPGLLRATAAQNVAYPLRARGTTTRDAMTAARSWLARVGLGDACDARAATLSGGEAQRVALARALATRPEALLLDEATNQLDPEGTRLVEVLLREERRRGAAIVLVTHNVQQARRLADRVAFLHAGQLEAYGARGSLGAPTTPGLRAFLDVG